MNIYKDALERTLTADDARFLDAIYSPRVVAVPDDEALCSLCVGDDGEIRCYGRVPGGYGIADSTGDTSRPTEVYLSSRDCGLSWKRYFANPRALGQAVKSPWSGRWLRAVYNPERRRAEVRISEGGFDSEDYRTVIVPGVTKRAVIPMPLALNSRRRWILPGSYTSDAGNHSFVAYSDDDGDSWRVTDIPPTERFTVAPPHRSPRWENSGLEPTVAELSDGSLMMILRTSTDYHYECRSFDAGETWTSPRPTAFHSTLTMPHLLRLDDRRLLFFYNNTRPLPEFDKSEAFPTLNSDELAGVWEDVFTNRDANCVAVSEDDGRSWFGFRELYLNPLRNACDFRSSGGNRAGGDKSVHQFQALELPRGKVMVHVGQHSRLRRVLIFDVDWLYETRREESFKEGLDGVSTHVYVKSISGGLRDGHPGHCAWNRTNGALLVPDPAGDFGEVLMLRRVDDPALYSPTQGVVWNFPAAKRGEVTVRLAETGGMRLALLDHWMNSCDDTLPLYAGVCLELPASGAAEIKVAFDTGAGEAKATSNGELLCTLPLNGAAPNGFCYLHLQTTDAPGHTLVRSLKAVKLG